MDWWIADIKDGKAFLTMFLTFQGEKMPCKYEKLIVGVYVGRRTFAFSEQLTDAAPVEHLSQLGVRYSRDLST